MMSQGNNDKGDIHTQIQKFLNGQTPEQAGLSPRQEEVARRMDALADEQGNLNMAVAQHSAKINGHEEIINQLSYRVAQLEKQLKDGPVEAKRPRVWQFVQQMLGIKVIE